jgi:hypothetical protein
MPRFVKETKLTGHQADREARAGGQTPEKDSIMNSPTCGLRVASVVFGLICLGQLLRIILRIQLLVGTCYVHRWHSAVVVVITGLLCVWLWMLAAKTDQPKPDAAPAKPAA